MTSLYDILLAMYGTPYTTEGAVLFDVFVFFTALFTVILIWLIPYLLLKRSLKV